MDLINLILSILFDSDWEVFHVIISLSESVKKIREGLIRGKHSVKYI